MHVSADLLLLLGDHKLAGSLSRRKQTSSSLRVSNNTSSLCDVCHHDKSAATDERSATRCAGRYSKPRSHFNAPSALRKYLDILMSIGDKLATNVNKDVASFQAVAAAAAAPRCIQAIIARRKDIYSTSEISTRE
jgi:hypothetical protein